MSQRRIKRPLSPDERLKKLAGSLRNEDELIAVVFRGGSKLNKEVYLMIRPHVRFRPSAELDEWAGFAE